MDIELFRKQARDESTSPKILAELAGKKDMLTRQYVASNPNTPIEILEKLSREFPEEVMSNRAFVLLSTEEPDNTLIQLVLARSLTTPIETLIELSKCDSFDIREAVAENSNTPLSVLNKLATREDNKPFPAKVFNAIAKNNNTTEEILDKLVKYNHDDF